MLETEPPGPTKGLLWPPATATTTSTSFSPRPKAQPPRKAMLTIQSDRGIRQRGGGGFAVAGVHLFGQCAACEDRLLGNEVLSSGPSLESHGYGLQRHEARRNGHVSLRRIVVQRHQRKADLHDLRARRGIRQRLCAGSL